MMIAMIGTIMTTRPVDDKVDIPANIPCTSDACYYEAYTDWSDGVVVFVRLTT